MIQEDRGLQQPAVETAYEFANTLALFVLVLKA
jgi:hypothetical protein